MLQHQLTRIKNGNFPTSAVEGEEPIGLVNSASWYCLTTRWNECQHLAELTGKIELEIRLYIEGMGISESNDVFKQWVDASDTPGDRKLIKLEAFPGSSVDLSRTTAWAGSIIWNPVEREVATKLCFCPKVELDGRKPRVVMVEIRAFRQHDRQHLDTSKARIRLFSHRSGYGRATKKGNGAAPVVKSLNFSH